MVYANYYVGSIKNEQKYNGCFKQIGPTVATSATLSGNSNPISMTNITPVSIESQPGLWIYAAQQGEWIKMVGMMYSNHNSTTRVDGRAYNIGIDKPVLNPVSVLEYWTKATLTGIDNQDFTLTISNNSPLKSINSCMAMAADNNHDMFSITNMQNGIGQCNPNENMQDLLNHSPTPGATDIEDKMGYMGESVTETQCLSETNTKASYTILSDTTNSLGKTYLGKKDTNGDQYQFHEYPESMLNVGNKFVKHSAYDSIGNTLSDGLITDATSIQCEQYCINRGQECKGFVYNNSTSSCDLKGNIYPNTAKQPSTITDVYTRQSGLLNQNACSSGVQAVSTDFLLKNGIISTDKMSVNTQCETEAGVKLEKDNIIASYTLMSDEIDHLKTENNDIITQHNKIQTDVREKTEQYNNTDKNIKSKTENVNNTMSKLLSDSSELYKRKKTILMVMLFIALFIVLTLVLK